jgi:hypothetical protein
MTALARPARVARMLLRSTAIVFVSVMSACVLPIAPEFQDPPAAANFSPVIIDSMPPIGSIVGPTSTPTTFTISITDPNLGDDLHVRWIADFPPDTGNTRTLNNPPTTVSHRTDGMPINADVSQTPSCNINSLAKIPQHQIMAIVADRPFDDSPTADLTKLQGTDGHSVIATWILNLDCATAP